MTFIYFYTEIMHAIDFNLFENKTIALEFNNPK